jgi:hypothetical protein
MLIARQKRKENIAEYVIYMWHVEDLIRSYNFDIEKIDRFIVQKFEQPDHVKKEIKNWYSGLIKQIKKEKIIEKGHLNMISSIMNEMNDFHMKLLNKTSEKQYLVLYKMAAPNIIALRNKSSKPDTNDVEICLNGLYGVMMMRLQKKEINKETEEAVNTFSNLLAALSNKFKAYEEGKLDL